MAIQKAIQISEIATPDLAVGIAMTSKGSLPIKKGLLALSQWFNLQSGVDPLADHADGGADGLICCDYAAYYKLCHHVKGS